MRSFTRTVRTLAAVGVLAVLGGACGSGGGDTAGDDTTDTAAGGDATAEEAGAEPPMEPEDTIVVAGSGGDLRGYFEEAFAGWAEENGVRIQWVEGLATDHVGRVVAQKNNPEIDLLQGELVSHFAAASQDVFETIDPTRVPNLTEFPEKAISEDGAAVTPFVEVVGVWWNQEKFDEAGVTPPETWDDVWALTEDPALEGHVVFPSIDNGYMRTWIANQLEDASDPTPIYERLAEIDHAVLEYPRSPAAMYDLAVAGDAWLGVTSYTRMLDMVDADIGIDFTLPQPVPLVPFSVSRIKNAPHPNAADSLLNYILSAEGQQSMAEATNFSPMVPGVEVEGDQFLPSDVVSNAVAWDYATVEQNLESWRTKFAEVVREISE